VEQLGSAPYKLTDCEADVGLTEASTECGLSFGLSRLEWLSLTGPHTSGTAGPLLNDKHDVSGVLNPLQRVTSSDARIFAMPVLFQIA